MNFFKQKQFEHVSFDDTMTRGTPLVLRSWSRSQETVSATAITVESHFGIFILLCETIRRTNKQTNERGCSVSSVATDPSRGSAHRPPRCHARRGRLEIEFGFRQTKNSFLILSDAIAALLTCVAVVRPPFHAGTYLNRVHNGYLGDSIIWWILQWFRTICNLCFYHCAITPRC